MLLLLLLLLLLVVGPLLRPRAMVRGCSVRFPLLLEVISVLLVDATAVADRG